MKQLNWYQIFGNTHTIPDGRTVTPTDDIQTLLHCANIWDKSYTTIGEVIADDDTLFLTLIDNNAIDYLVRSTTFASSIVTSESAMQYIGASDYASETLLSDSTWNTAIQNSPYFEDVDNAKVPVMTSNTTPSGEAFASNEYSSQYAAYKAFDGSLVDNSGEWATTDTSASWVAYDFETPVKVYKWGVYSRYATTQKYKIQGSSDRNTWTDESTQHSGLSNNAWHYFEADVSNSANRYHRLYMENTNTHYTNLKELQLYGRQAGGVQSWLKAGGIEGKKYTTVSEVLSDLTTLATLMSSSDAIDYLVTAKGWATEICSDSNAMADIGMNNYAANTLLADETWRNAIANSTYIDSVLNAKVPVLTGVSTRATNSVNYGSSYYYPWQAFSANTAAGWYPGNQPNVNGSCWLQWDFENKVKVVKVDIKHIGSGSYSQTYKIQGSNDNDTWTDVSDVLSFSSMNQLHSFVFANSNKYRYCRICYLSISTTYNIGSGLKFQFYGRKDI
jgi:hypothetical protein